MRVKMITHACGPDGNFPPGSRWTVSARAGAALIAGKFAIAESGPYTTFAATRRGPGNRGRGRRRGRTRRTRNRVARAAGKRGATFDKARPRPAEDSLSPCS